MSVWYIVVNGKIVAERETKKAAQEYAKLYKLTYRVKDVKVEQD